MVWGGWSCNISEIIVTERELSRIREVRWNVSLSRLLTDRSRLPGQPSAVPMIRVPRGWIRRPGHLHPVGPGKGPEVIVEGMIFLENDHNVINFARAKTACLLLPRRHVKH